MTSCINFKFEKIPNDFLAVFLSDLWAASLFLLPLTSLLCLFPLYDQSTLGKHQQQLIQLDWSVIRRCLGLLWNRIEEGSQL